MRIIAFLATAITIAIAASPGIGPEQTDERPLL